MHFSANSPVLRHCKAKALHAAPRYGSTAAQCAAFMAKKLPVLVLTALLLTCTLISAPEAAVRVLNAQSSTSSTEVASKAAKRVGCGTHRVYLSKGENGYLKFTAPAADRYTLSFSGLRTKYAYDCGYIALMTAQGENGQSLVKRKVRTQGGKTTDLELATQRDKTGSRLTKHLTRRSARIALNKGQTLYIYFSFNRGDSLRMTIDQGL